MKNKIQNKALGMSLFFLVSAMSAQQIQEEPVIFDPGSNSAVMQDKVKGREIIDYLFNASPGSYLNISLASMHPAVYFNLMEPGEQYEAIFNGSVRGNQFEGTATKNGDYRIRVYMMRSAARRNESAEFRLEVIAERSKDGTASKDALVPGTDFNATGTVRCSVAKDGSQGYCPFGVIRGGNGDAKVVLTRKDGLQRILIFRSGQAVGLDQREEGVPELRSEMDGDTYIIYIADERYEIPEAIIYGG